MRNFIVLFLLAAQSFAFAQNDTIYYLNGKEFVGTAVNFTDSEVFLDIGLGKVIYCPYYDIHSAVFTTASKSESFWIKYNSYWNSPTLAPLTRQQVYRAGKSFVNFGNIFYPSLALGLVGTGMMIGGTYTEDGLLFPIGASFSGLGGVGMIISFSQIGRAGRFLRGKKTR